MGSDSQGIDELTEWHRAGRLAAEYPSVRAVLREDDPETLLRHGHLLARLDPAEVLRHHPDQQVADVAVTGHGTLAALVPALTAELARHGLLLRPHLADFDSYVFDLGDPAGPLYAEHRDLVVCLLDPRVVLDELPSPWRVEHAEQILLAKVDLIGRLAAEFDRAGGSALAVGTLPLTREATAQLVAVDDRTRLAAAWHAAGAALLDLARTRPRLTVLDLAPMLAEGVPVTEPRMSAYAKAHLSDQLLAACARDLGHVVRRLTGRVRKCLVLDLDGTLWGGILGDDGPEGIELGTGRRGEAFAAFQRVVKQLGSQGVLLAVVSKNDIEPVRAVLREHTGMQLAEQDFVRVIADWRPKHESIKELAEVLNLGLDAFVFADDSAYECALVARELPEVEVIRLGPDPALHPSALLRDGWFDAAHVTAEDVSRGALYREDLERQDFLASFSGIEDYLRELRTEVRLAPVTPEQIPRVAQLTQRTNQFNLTTVRFQEQDVRTLAADPDHLVLTIRASDRFGDAGLVGLLVYRRDGEVGLIENMLLSCRVFARSIEHSCLAALLRHARATGVQAVHAAFRQTPKNGKVRMFYPTVGFAMVRDDGDVLHFRHGLEQIPDTPKHLTLTAVFPEGVHA
ncbi:HAD-IIIC family phosphatase [Streptomyces sp. NPDC056161]|uniref:HAD-IIIC family phosphatase n=1 Tax=Streptomyces sp. NPDC056161 TaxID=3345732 RepID=UPI0035E14E0F